MNPDKQPIPTPSRFLKRFFICVGLAVAIFFLLIFSAREQWVLQLPYHLLIGWALHGAKALSHFLSNVDRLASAAALPCAAALVALFGFHRLVLWWRQATGRSGEWRIKHTALAGVLALLGSSAAIALSGVLHEAVWLPQGKVIQSNHSSTRMLALNDARNLGFHLFDYQDEHGVFPDSMRDLEKFVTEQESGFRFASFARLDHPSPAEPFVFVNPGAPSDGLREFILIGPQLPGRGEFVVVRSDLSTATMPRSKFIEVVTSASWANKEAR